MSSIEEQLARDIAAVTGGVVVTDSDLRKARETVEDRIVIDRQRRRRRTGAAVAAAAVVIPILGVAAFQTLDDNRSAPPAGPVPTTPNADNEAFLTGSAPTPELLEGVWRVDNGTLLLKFTADGAIQFDDGGRLYSDPGAIGTYVIDGDLITVTVDGGPARCGGQTFAMRASLPEPGAMRFVHTQPGTRKCSPQNVPVDDQPATTDSVWWALEQTLPTNNEYLAGFDNSHAPGWKPMADRIPLRGDWLAEGGGHVLELASGGTYYVADDTADVVDRGQWSRRGSVLTLTSSAASDECSKGDRLVLGALEQLNPGTTVIRGKVRQNACGGAWASKTWILIPHKGS